MKYILQRKAANLIMFLVCVLSLVGYRTWMMWEDRPQESLVFYNVRNCPAVHCIASNGMSWLAYADGLTSEKRLVRTATPYWNRLRLSQPVAVVGDYNDHSFIRQGDIVSFDNQRVCLVNDNQWKNKESDNPLDLDYLYVCKGYTGKIEWLKSVFSIKNVVLDSSLPAYRRAAFQAECKQLGVNCISLWEKAYIYKPPI